MVETEACIVPIQESSAFLDYLGLVLVHDACPADSYAGIRFEGGEHAFDSVGAEEAVAVEEDDGVEGTFQ